MSVSGYEDAPPTWGAWAPPEMVAERLEIDRHLLAVPVGGTVVDLGAGVAMSLCAHLYAKRPDLRIIPIDPGYDLLGIAHDLEAGHTDALKSFDNETRACLQASDAWHREALTAYGEELPLSDLSVDFIASHAALPDYATNTELVAQELVRVLQIGGMAVNGPIHDWAFEPWLDLLELKKANGEISELQHTKRELPTHEGRTATGFFTYFKK
jgi:SAM-dependent methyltransferase